MSRQPVISDEWEAWFESWLAYYVPEALSRPGVFEQLLGVIDTEIKGRDELIGAAYKAANEALAAEVANLQRQLSRGWRPW